MTICAYKFDDLNKLRSINFQKATHYGDIIYHYDGTSYQQTDITCMLYQNEHNIHLVTYIYYSF